MVDKISKRQYDRNIKHALEDREDPNDQEGRYRCKKAKCWGLAVPIRNFTKAGMK